ncbi:MAG: YtxH domain-containing protein [Bacilli bacterium]|nr:YtxH domain-containing protein [Bacilli bacterium]
MNFDVSSKFSASVGAVSVGKMAVVNSRVYDDPVPEMDYSDSKVGNDDVSFDEPHAAKMFLGRANLVEYIWESFYNHAKRTMDESKGETKGFVVEKGTTTIGWATTKWAIADVIQTALGGDVKSGSGFLCYLLSVSLLEGGLKMSLKDFSGILSGNEVSDQKNRAELFKGFTKSATKIPADAGKKALKSLFIEKGILPESISMKGMGELIDKAGSAFQPRGGSWWDKIMSKGFKRFESNETAAGVKKFSGTFSGTLDSIGGLTFELGMSFGIDYFTGLAANVIGGLANDGKLELSEVGFGSTALKSSTKIIFATAGEIAFGKAGKIVGTAVGAFIGEFQVAAFTDENGNVQEGWCGAAAGMQLVGAVAGAVLIACLVSNPAGWVVGAAIIAGAAVGFAVTWVAKEIVENWGEVTEFFADAKEAVVEAYQDAKEAVVEAYQDVKENVTEFIDEAKEKVKEVKENVKKAVKSRPVANFLIGWAL